MSAIDLSLYLVLDPGLCGGPDGMAHTALIAAENGATAVQLRAPDWKKRQWFETARVLKQALSPLGVPLIINDQVDVALAVGAGVHVGQADLPVAEVRRLLGPEAIVGLSVSDPGELVAVPNEGIDYLGIGPVYPTGSKADAAPATGLALFAELVRAAHLPVVAIGGISNSNCAPLFAAGAQGIAVISAICGQADVAAATRSLRREIDRART